MLIRVFSDLHGRLPAIDPCDGLLIAGDVCPIVGDHGPPAQLHWLRTTFSQWLSELPIERVLLTAGNHDFAFQQLGAGADYGLPQAATLLLDEGAQLGPDGPQVFGQPWVPSLPAWAFHAEDAELARRAAAIPDGCDIWMQHGPPKPPPARDGEHFALDYVSPSHVGNAAITDELLRRGPAVLVCGHIHEGFGHAQIGATDVYNVSFLDEFYDTRWRHLELEWDAGTRSFSRKQLITAERGVLEHDCIEQH